jgi:hypothetical protein
MRSTAHRVEPARPRNWRRIFAAGLLTVGGLAGALGAVARRRKSTTLAAAEEEDDQASADSTLSDNGQVRTP